MGCHSITDSDETGRSDALDRILEYHTSRFQQAAVTRTAREQRHVGLELKFPVVTSEGDAVDDEVIDAFWQICREAGWEPMTDSHAGRVTGVRGGADDNPDYIRTTTGICVLEFSVAHCPDLFQLERHLHELSGLAAELTERTGARLLGLGIQPKTPPGPELLAKKGRHLFWDDALPPCPDTPHGHEGNVELFTVIADNQVHVDTDLEHATAAVNVLNGLAGPILALTANSSVWRGKPDHRHLAVRELFWDWWIGDAARSGMPDRPFDGFADYVRATAELGPVLTERSGQHVSLCHYPTFLDYYASDQPVGLTADGDEVPLAPCPDDIDVHDRAFWWNARISRFATAECRVCCQQPPDELLGPAALVLGLTEATELAEGLLAACPWEELKQLRVQAAHVGLDARAGRLSAYSLGGSVLTIAERGLQRRGLGEEAFLGTLQERHRRQQEPAREARAAFAVGNWAEFVRRYTWP